MLILYLLIGINSIPFDTIISSDAAAYLLALTVGHSVILSEWMKTDKKWMELMNIGDY